MAPLLHCPYSSEVAEARWAIDVPEAHAHPRHHNYLFRQRQSSFSSCSWLLRSVRFLSPHIHHHVPLGNGNLFSFTLSVGIRNSFRKSPVMSLEKGMCKVVWTIEADLAVGELLYITGDPIVLGCWDPKMAILMSPTERANSWKAEVKIDIGANFKYNYFIKRETWPYEIIWRPGPEFSLSVFLPVKQGKNIVVRDSWVRFNTELSPAHSLRSWIEDAYHAIQPFISAPDIDEDERAKHFRSDSTDTKQSSGDLSMKDELYSDHNIETSVCEESVSDRFFTKKHQPIEEPWLLQTPLYSTASKDKMKLDVLRNNETVEDNGTELEDKEKLLPQQGINVISKDPISTIILINSSICTMQRIAVLEDGKLVELLLEPVKNNVQCDSVYLGVVTKLVPHMGGAFVNIGSSRPSLMDIKRNREPFIFPPFRQRTTKREVNGALSEVLAEHSAALENDHASLGIELSDEITEIGLQEDSVQSFHDHDDEHESDDDLDITEVLRDNENGSLLSYGEAEAHYEDSLDGQEHQVGSETISGSFHAALNGSSHFQMPDPRDTKDSEYTVTSVNKWAQVQKGTKVIVQVVKEGLGAKGPTLTAFPKLRSRFWVLISRCDRIGVSKKISGVERTRLKVIAKTLQPEGFGLTVRTVAAGHSLEELQKDLEGLLSTWKNIMEHAKSAALAADEGVEGAVPVILHRPMGQTLSVVQDYFNEMVERMVVDSARTYHEVTNYLQEIAPDLCDRVELYNKRIPLFDEFNIEEKINSMLSKRVPLANGGSLVIEQTEALVSIDVNGGHGMFGHETSQEKAILDVNLAAAKQIARELRLRDIGGIIVVDFIDMADDSHKRLVYEEVKKAVDRDRSMVKVSELSRHGLMEITRKRVRPSVTFMISEPCPCCHATGRVEALETSFSKIEQEISRLLATVDQKADPENPKSWPKFILRVDHYMCDYLTSGKRTRLAILSSSLKVWILLKVARGFTRGAFEVKLFTDDKANENQHQVNISMLRPTETRNKEPGKKVTLFQVKKWKGGRK